MISGLELYSEEDDRTLENGSSNSEYNNLIEEDGVSRNKEKSSSE